MGRKRIITIKLTRAEAEALMNAGNRGVADLHDTQDYDQLDVADTAESALDKLGAAMQKAWPEPTETTTLTDEV